MRQIFYIVLFILIQSTLYSQNNTTYDKAFEEYKNKNYTKSVHLFEKSFNEGINKQYSAYMIGYINLYFSESIDYNKALKYLQFVENDIPKDLNKNYLFNHIGLCFLYEAINIKENNNYFDDKLLKAHYYFTKALKIKENDITWNNLGRTNIESLNIDSVVQSSKQFRIAYEISPNPQYKHNEATAFERVGNMYYNKSILGNSFDYEILKLSYNNYLKANELYFENQHFYKSKKRIEVIYLILSRPEFQKYK